MSKVAPQEPSSNRSSKKNDKELEVFGKGTLSQFTVDKKIGKGQFSSVYKATRLSDGAVVALKKVPVLL